MGMSQAWSVWTGVHTALGGVAAGERSTPPEPGSVRNQIGTFSVTGSYRQRKEEAFLTDVGIS